MVANLGRLHCAITGHKLLFVMEDARVAEMLHSIRVVSKIRAPAVRAEYAWNVKPLNPAHISNSHVALNGPRPREGDSKG